MESKVCTYSEPKVRLQLVRIQNGSDRTFVIRFNRRVISRTFNNEEVLLARLYFSHLVAKILVDRDPQTLSNMT